MTKLNNQGSKSKRKIREKKRPDTTGIREEINNNCQELFQHEESNDISSSEVIKDKPLLSKNFLKKWKNSLNNDN